ncbi:MAG: two-component system, OmpR family, sensor kinase, partial [Gaiellaceae bacterium]|nr:two-component system, OmpR family, sensor kinase [Gaiellaceae bacterium]
MLARLSLRARLLLGVLALATVGLLAADVATYSELRSFLFQRTDNSLNAAHRTIETVGIGPASAPTLASAVPNDWVAVRYLNGRVYIPLQQTSHFERASPPRIPAHVTLPAAQHGAPERWRYFTVPSSDGTTHYRLRVSNDVGSQYVLLVATSLHPVEETLHRLLLIELLTTLAVLGAIGGLGLYVVRLGLRPLDEIETTAAAIGAGDLSQRVERAEERTEVGRLGLALNAMLGQIESAFKAREASESRLRRFVADASHELRTPLSAVRAYAELFSRG